MNLECESNDHDLILSLQNELDLYKNEHEKLRQKIEEVTKLNQQSDNVGDDIDRQPEQAKAKFLSYKQISTDAINNLKGQIEYINTKTIQSYKHCYLSFKFIDIEKERLTYYNLWKISQQTISNLEGEINQYLKQSNNSDSIQQLKNQIRASKQKMTEMRQEIDSGKSKENSLEKSRSICEAQMTALDKKYNDLTLEHKEVLARLKNMERVLYENRYENTELRKERDVYKIQLKSLCEQHKQYQQREAIAHAKIQDAIQMVEAAVAEKNAALQREKEIRDEWAQLAHTIGHVMEEAGEKIDGNIGEIKTNYSQRINKMEDIIKKLVVSKQSLSNNNHKSKEQLLDLQSNISNYMKANKTLNDELTTASKTIVELEMKLTAYEKLMACEQATTNECEERSAQFKELLENNIKLKQKWRETFNETTDKFQKELIGLQSENSRLIAENQKLNEWLKRNKS